MTTDGVYCSFPSGILNRVGFVLALAVLFVRLLVSQICLLRGNTLFLVGGGEKKQRV